MHIITPEDRRGIEEPFPPDWTIFRKDEHEPPKGVVATLEDLGGWTAEVVGLEGAAFGSSPAFALWGETGTFIDYPASDGPSSVTLRPPAPLSFPEDCDQSELWVRSDFFEHGGAPPHFGLSLLFQRTAGGDEQELIVDTHFGWNTYTLRIKGIPDGLRRGWTLSGIRIFGNDPKKAHRFGLDSLGVYRDDLQPLTLAPRPKRPLTLPDGQSRGLNTGPGWLPFPTRAETILPDNLTVTFRNTTKREETSFLLRYRAKDADLSYSWRPAEDPFRVEVNLDGHPVGVAMADVFLAGREALPWFESGDWPGPFARAPLPPDAVHVIPTVFRWAGMEHAATMVEGDSLQFDYDPVRYGSNAIAHAYRYLYSDAERDVVLGFGADWGLGIWVNGTLLADKLDGCGCVNPDTVQITAKLRKGRNLVICRTIEKRNLAVMNILPLPPEVRWEGPWHVFGPTPNKLKRLTPAGQLSFKKAAIRKKVVVAFFDHAEFGSVEIHMQMMAKSLVVDVACPGGRLAVVDQGHFESLCDPAVFETPPMEDNAILRVKSGGKTIFISQLLDWYRSNASKPTIRFYAKGDRAQLIGPVFYSPKTDGTLNPVHERFFLTCSSVFEEVLPNIPNPPSLWAAETGKYVFRESWGPAEIQKERDKVRHLVTFGINRIIHLHHEVAWEHQSDGEMVNDGCTLRTEVSPHKGGNKAMADFMAENQALGLRQGLYTNYQDYYPLNSLFSRDKTILASDGTRQRAWVHSYAMKPSLAVQFDAGLAPRIAQAFHPNAAYTDCATCSAPWQLVDFDARVPGAGTFAATFYAFGEFLLNDQRHYNGPVISEGFYHWLFAGLVSGNYGQLAHFGRTGHDPLGALDPSFNLLKVHPLETDVGLSVTPDHFLKCRGTDWERGTDRYLCAVLAYGHIAYLPTENYGDRLLLRVYHLARAASCRYAGLRPVAIEFQTDNGKWLNLSEVHAQPLKIECRLRVIYPAGLVLHVNWGWEHDWVVADQRGKEVVLPPNGFVLDSPEEVVSASTLVAGNRCDRAQTPESWYIDGRGHEAFFGPLTAAGSAALLTDASRPGRYVLIDGGGNQEITVATEYAGRAFTAVSADGATLAEGLFQPKGRRSVIRCVDEAVRYEWQVGS